jgi:hypothetical protein
METIGTWWMLSGFLVIVLSMLAVDLFVVGGSKQHRVSSKEAATQSAIWVGVSLGLLVPCSCISTAPPDVSWPIKNAGLHYRPPDRAVAGHRQRLRLADFVKLVCQSQVAARCPRTKPLAR